MNLSILLSLLVAIIGLVVYAIATNGKAQQIGLFAWGAGLTAFLIQFSGALSLTAHG